MKRRLVAANDSAPDAPVEYDTDASAPADAARALLDDEVRALEEQIDAYRERLRRVGVDASALPALDAKHAAFLKHLVASDLTQDEMLQQLRAGFAKTPLSPAALSNLRGKLLEDTSDLHDAFRAHVAPLVGRSAANRDAARAADEADLPRLLEHLRSGGLMKNVSAIGLGIDRARRLRRILESRGELPPPPRR